MRYVLKNCQDSELTKKRSNVVNMDLEGGGSKNI